MGGRGHDFAPEVAEAGLAHAIKSGIERAYKRTTFFDHRRKLMKAWSDYCEGKATGWLARSLRCAARGMASEPTQIFRRRVDQVGQRGARVIEQGDGISYDPLDMSALLRRLIELIEAERRRRGRPASVSKRKPPKFSNTGLLAWAREPTKDRRMLAVALRRLSCWPKPSANANEARRTGCAAGRTETATAAFKELSHLPFPGGGFKAVAGFAVVA